MYIYIYTYTHIWTIINNAPLQAHMSTVTKPEDISVVDLVIYKRIIHNLKNVSNAICYRIVCLCSRARLYSGMYIDGRLNPDQSNETRRLLELL
jgi:hypothetical protein